MTLTRLFSRGAVGAATALISSALLVSAAFAQTPPFTVYGSDAGAGATVTVSSGGNDCGTATADYDDDGDLDICTLANGDRAYLYRNDSTVGSWLQCQLRGTQSNRSGIGARLMLWSGGKVQYAEVRSGTSYLSQSDLRVHFGLGKAHQADRLLIYWPSGVRQVLTALTANQNLEIIEPDRP